MPVQRTVVTVPRGRLLLWGICFTSLGLGFIAVEMVLIQRLGLFLGYPAYALSVVLCTLLLASGLGSMLAGRWTRPGNFTDGRLPTTSVARSSTRP
jgi:hypothetical protein